MKKTIGMSEISRGSSYGAATSTEKVQQTNEIKKEI